MRLYRVLVIGGHGLFGSRLVERLLQRPGFHVIAAGRSGRRGRSWTPSLLPAGASTWASTGTSAVLDVQHSGFAAALAALAPDVVVHTAGPFQGQQYGVARACIATGAHYIDLADGREFVSGITCLSNAASKAKLAVISGASSVPALSSAVTDHLARGFSRVDSIDIGISPGNRTERGLSTIKAILHGCGRRIPVPDECAVYGWIGSRRQRYPAPVGSRLLSPCDVPDWVLLPMRYAGHPQVRFGAGLELTLLHRGLNLIANMVRLGLVADASVVAAPLKWLADLVKGLGSDAGAMHVAVAGRTAEGRLQTRTWHLIATAGDGPYVPTLAASCLIQKLERGTLSWTGAKPCVGLLTLDELAAEAQGLRITMSETTA